MSPSGLDPSFIRCPLILDGAIGAAVEEGTIIHKDGKSGGDLLKTCEVCRIHSPQSFLKLAGYATVRGNVKRGILIKSDVAPEAESNLRPIGTVGWTPSAREF